MELLVGTDNLHFKRKQRSLRSLERKKGRRKPYDVVLIVCEGSETEPNYLKGLREHLRLNPVNVVIQSCSSGSDPVSIVNFALKEHERNDYDHIYCVFDKEQSNYQEALDQIKANRKKGIPIHAIFSVPCFEYWLLLHFIDTTKPYHRKGKKTAGEQLKSELKKYIKGYHEAAKDIFEKTKPYLTEAITRAKRIDKLQKKNGTDNPSTKVYQLVEYLFSINK
jgi:hypothetical protein